MTLFNLDDTFEKRQWRGYLVGVLLLWSGAAGAQSAMFSQYYFSPMNVNPALLGTQPHATIGAQHRSQWRNLERPYQASMFSVVKPVTLPTAAQQTGGIGVTLVNESVGTNRLYRSLEANLGAAYNLSLDRERTRLLSFGLQGGFTQRRLNPGQLRWGSQYDPTVGYDPNRISSVGVLNERVSFASFSAGLVYYYNPSQELLLRRVSGFAGLSVSNLNRPYTSFSPVDRARASRTLRGHAGLTFPLSPTVKVLPQALVVYRDAQQSHVNVGSYVHYLLSPSRQPKEKSLELLAGAWYRWSDSWVASAGLSYHRYLLAVSYDFNTQPVATHAFRGGAFEVSLAYRWFTKQRMLRNFSTPMI